MPSSLTPLKIATARESRRLSGKPALHGLYEVPGSLSVPSDCQGRPQGEGMTVETTATGASAIDRARIAELTEREMAKLAERTPASKQRYERAVKVMPKGVPSSFQENDPWPVYVERGEGTRVWDVDGHEDVDFHNGFGVMCIGHANPTVGAAVKARVDLGTH